MLMRSTENGPWKVDTSSVEGERPLPNICVDKTGDEMTFKIEVPASDFRLGEAELRAFVALAESRIALARRLGRVRA